MGVPLLLFTYFQGQPAVHGMEAQRWNLIPSLFNLPMIRLMALMVNLLSAFSSSVHLMANAPSGAFPDSLELDQQQISNNVKLGLVDFP